MKKGKIAVGIIIVYCAVVFGVYLGKTGFFGTTVHDMGAEMEEVSDTAEVTVGENLSFTSDIDADILSRHALPGLERMEKGDQDQYVNNLQVIKKVELLGVGKRDFLYPEIKMSEIEERVSLVKEGYHVDGNKVVFEGSTSEELQRIIDENPDTVIDVRSEQIQINNAIALRNGTIINGNGVKFTSKGTNYGIIGENVSNVYINDVHIDGNIEYGLYFVDCNNISVTESEINRCLQKAICIVGVTEGFIIDNNRMYNNGAGTLYVAGDVSGGLIENNSVGNSCGTSNWMAGMVFTSDNPQNKWDIWDNYINDAHRWPYREKIYEELMDPHNIIVRNNEIFEGNSSGIYSDGAYNCYIVGNRVKHNDKEGICLDNGTIGFYLKGNTFDGNGQRIRQTDDDLRYDHVLETGRMDDGSAKSKLPGISLDNTAYNILENNIVINNYGGGIKMVRTTVRTLIMENIVKDNNKGQNDSFHFFGVELGAAVADEESGDLDFASDFENIICRNSITGNHYSGVFIGEDCYVNDVFDNVIMEPQMFAVEAISGKFNSIVNNISNAGIRNEYQIY
ncbi:MAG: right-handed parallel beta-helix repeat-containing protein [bacterium]|nr:right-handed parallel beta-helix repeat-containing protein [bacterium]